MRNELIGEEIFLRRYRPDDIDEQYEAIMESKKELSRWLTWCHRSLTKKECESWIATRNQAWEAGSEYSFVLCETETGSLIGSCSLNEVNTLHRFANIGYWVRSSKIGRGYATAAVRLVASFGFNDLHLNRLGIIAAVHNTTSQRVAEKVGAFREGILRNRVIVHETVYDAVCYSLIPWDILNS